jgi:hypothetical protein
MEANYTTERYDQGNVTVTLEMPPISFVSIEPNKVPTGFHRADLAIQVRTFQLNEDWFVELGGVRYAPELNGQIKIPDQINGKSVEFDGASVPCPRTISWLTQGILAPMGVMFTPSIVHDFLFQTGYLLVKQESGEFKPVEVERHIADRLFRDMIQSVNRIWAVHWLAWLAVRLGWVLGVRYNGKLFGGRPPIVEGLFGGIALWAGSCVFYRIGQRVLERLADNSWAQYLVAGALPFVVALLLIPAFVWGTIKLGLLLYRLLPSAMEGSSADR